MKIKCSQILKESFGDPDEYYKASKWCVVPRKIESFISPSSLLDVNSEDNNPNASQWQSILTKYKTTKKGDQEKYEMDGVVLEADSGSFKDESNKKGLWMDVNQEERNTIILWILKILWKK